MGNTGIRNKIIALFCLLLFPWMAVGETARLLLKKKPEKDIHYRMLEKLKLDGSQEPEESFFRRGEVVFFVSFGYIWMYQFLIYEKVLPSVFREKAVEEELTDRNLFFAVITSLVLAFFVSRNDLQHYSFVREGKFYQYPGAADPSFDRRKKGYNWYFEFFSWEF